MQFLVEHGADPTVQDKDGWTPLHLASQNGHIGVVQFHVEHGADPTAQDKDRWTPLHSASKNGHAEIVQFLIEHGANLSPHDKDVMTKLWGLRGIWRRTKDMWKSHRSLSNHEPHESSSSATQV